MSPLKLPSVYRHAIKRTMARTARLAMHAEHPGCQPKSLSWYLFVNSGSHSSHPILAWCLVARAWVFSGAGFVLNNSPASAKNFSNSAGEIISTSLPAMSPSRIMFLHETDNNLGRLKNLGEKMERRDIGCAQGSVRFCRNVLQ